MATCDLKVAENMTEVIEGPFVLAPDEQFVICPYEPSHKILLDRLKCHLERCRRNYLKLMEEKKLSVTYNYCRYNDFHAYPEPEILTHEKYCPEKLRFGFETDLADDFTEEDIAAAPEPVDWNTFDGWRLAEDENPDVDDSKSDKWSTENLNFDEPTRINVVEELDEAGAESVRPEGDHASEVTNKAPKASRCFGRGSLRSLHQLPSCDDFGGLDLTYDEEEEKDGKYGDEEEVEEIWDNTKGFGFFMKPQALRSMPHRLSKTDKKAYHKLCTDTYAQRMESLNFSAKFHTQPKSVTPANVVDPYLVDGGRGLAKTADANLSLKGDDGFVDAYDAGW